jgi:glycosyltransferase involved in cell wall biosynthesis
MADADRFLADAAFWMPDRLVESGWTQHIPFAFWLVGALRPRTIVELGVASGASYCAWCQGVDRLGLATRCFGVDRWTGDEHAGFYGEEVLSELAAYHDPRYGAFSRLVRSTFEDAAGHFADGTVDLLHIDGFHAYEAVRDDLARWRPKLADPAIVLLHDTNVRERGFGVFRLWAEVSQGMPHFGFHHGHGLGVLGVGSAPFPAPLQELFAAGRDEVAGGQIRRRFTRLGAALEERLEGRRYRARMAAEIARRDQAAAALRAQASEQERRLREAVAARLAAEEALARVRAESAGQEGRIAELRIGLAGLVQRLEESARRRQPVEAELAAAAEGDALCAELAACRSALEAAAARLAEIEGSTTWQATALARRYLHRHPGLAGLGRRLVGRTQRSERPRPDAALPARPSAALAALPRSLRGRPRILFVSGEPLTPGHLYRVERMANALPTAFFDVQSVTAESLDGGTPASADLLWIWRARWTPTLEALVQRLRDRGCRVVFDIDDLMFRPDLATPTVIDGIRSQSLGEAGVQDHYAGIRRMVEIADHATAPTPSLARELRELGRAATVIPNAFDRDTLDAALLARAWRLRRAEDGLLRIGYASGSKTHQRDFAVAAPAVAALLAERPEARLVLFRRTLDIEELPALAAHADRIEWRDMVPLRELPMEYARFDINLAPLEVGNPFCEAKSELKFFEAALVEVPTIASPTEPYRQAIQDGVTGLLAADTAGWLNGLRRLAAERPLRHALGRRAHHEVLWRYGPERRAHLATRLVRRLLSPPDLAATVAGAELAELTAPRPDLPVTAPFDLLFQSDRRGGSRVSVVIPLYNYRDVIGEALDSVLAQTRRDIDVVVVDDCSTDDSAAVAQAWLERHAASFSRVSLLRHRGNAKLGTTRNTAVAFSETELFLPLDADNLLLPSCIECCLERLDHTGAAFACPTIEVFGARSGWQYRGEWDPILLRGGNVVDAMALVRKACWAAVGGYAPMNLGWEDYDFWCKFIEAGFFGARVEEVTARYREHVGSMLRTVTELSGNKRKVVAEIAARHPWLLLNRSAQPAEEPGGAGSQPAAREPRRGTQGSR